MNLSIPFIVALTILGLAGIGMYCLLASRNLIRVIVGLQLIIKGVALAFVLGGNLSGNVNLGQTLGLTVIVADTIVAVVGLSMAVQIRHSLGTLDVKELSSLKR